MPTDSVYFKTILLALAQGLSEFLPISSSGHIVILQKWLNFSQNQFFYNVVFHFGTLLAVLFFFRVTIFNLAGDFLNEVKTSKLNNVFRDNNVNLVGKIALATLPAGLAGYFLKEKISFLFEGGSFFVLGSCFVAMGFYLFLTKKSLLDKVKMNEITYKIALLIGLAQVFALLPGISRSGITIVTGLLFGLKKEAAFTFSFFIGIPLFLAAFLLEIIELALTTDWLAFLSDEFFVIVLALGFSLVSGYWALKILLRLTLTNQLHWFSYYLILLGMVVLGSSL